MRSWLLPHRIVGLSVFLIVFGVYLFSINSVPTGYADSDELLTTGTLFAVSHPSGYPMVSLVSGLVFNLVKSFVGIPLVGNALAGILHALTILVLYNTLLKVFDIFFGHDSSKHWEYFSAAAGASVLLAFSAMYWLWGVKLEVVAFTSFLMSMTIYASIRWYAQIASGNASRAWFYATWILAGTGLAHVHIFIFVLPPLLLLLILGYNHWKRLEAYTSYKTWLLGLASFGGVFILINSLLLLFNSRGPDYSWYFPQNLQGWLHLITRQDYSGYFIELDRNIGAYMAQGTLSRFILAIPYYLRFLYNHITLFGMILMGVGIVYLIVQKDRLKWYLLSLFLVLGIMFGARLGYTPRDSGFEPFLDIGVMQRQYTSGEYSAFILVGFGLLAVVLNLSKTLGRRLAQLVSILFVGILVVIVVASHTPIGVQQGNDFVYRYASSMLETAEPNSTIICSSDIACYTLFYLSAIEGEREDVTVLTKNPKYRKHFLDQNPKYYPAVFEDNPNFYAELIAFNLQRGPVYLTNVTNFYKDYIGFEANPFFLIPKGYLYQVVTDPSQTEPVAPSTKIVEDLIRYPFAKQDFFGRGLRHYFADIHRSMGTLLSYYGEKQLAQIHLEAAATMYPEVQMTFDQLNYIPYYSGEPVYQQSSATTAASLYEDAAIQESLGNLDNAYTLLRKASYLEPYNSQFRLDQARLLMSGGFLTEASEQLEQIQIANPEGSSAAELMEQISNQI